MKRTFVTLREARELALWLSIEATKPKIRRLVTKDAGTCVVGNGISMYVKLPKKRKPGLLMVFSNSWSQCEQPDALIALVKSAREAFPSMADLIFYNSGNMD